MLTIGLMSGTSMDAIDTALVRFDEDSPDILEYRQYPIDDRIRHAVRALTSESNIKEISRLDAVLGKLFADAVLGIIDQAGLTPADIDVIGSHGQTVLHLPDAEQPRTLQIGDPDIIAFRTGITTVADFRRMDLAAGGQGAPLAPAFHNHYLRNPDKNRIILNIGGIANITLLPAEQSAPVRGFDTGPGNGLLDDWNFRHRRTSMDEDGTWAGSGNVDESLLKSLLEDPYFSLPPPKSSGRDYFNLAWLDAHLQTQGHTISAEGVQATLLQLSARTIADAVTEHAPETGEIYVCGGGVHNPLLMKTLSNHLPNLHIGSTRDVGIDPDAVEAVTFAWLARRRLEGKPGNLPSVTGAKKAVLLGAIYGAVTSNKS
ncbi:MAG: anhydro-N-acetylmuramic acid kinase [Gammaproteobacteria bacterium]